jgi:Flp pilus assembly protein TadD
MPARLDPLGTRHLLQNPDDARARIFYAHGLFQVGQKERAISESDAALELSPGDALMIYNGACLYAQLGEMNRAITTLRD